MNRLVPMNLARGAARRAAELGASSDTRVQALASAEREMAAVALREAAQVALVRTWGPEVLFSETRQGDITDTSSLAALGTAISATPRVYDDAESTDKNER